LLASAQLQAMSIQIALNQASTTPNEPVVIEEQTPVRGDFKTITATTSIPTTIIEKVIARSKEAGADPYTMTEIANCESGFDPKVKNIVKANPALKIKEEHSIGIFQVNTAPDAHPEYDRLLLENVDYNLVAAFTIWKNEGYGAWSNCLKKHLARKFKKTQHLVYGWC